MNQNTSSATLRPMTPADIDRVIDIIAETDEDDAQGAGEQFAESGIAHHHVLVRDNVVIGMTGYSPVNATDKTAWLSWTYLSKPYHRQGLGKQMLLALIDELKQFGCRKLFVKISDYHCPIEGDIYEAAYQLYLSVGFSIELTAKDFYDQGENLRILGLDITPDVEETPEIKEEMPNMVFNGLFEIDDTENAYSFTWSVPKTLLGFGKRCFTAKDLELGLAEVKRREGRKVFLTFPSNLPLIHDPLLEAGFKLVGKLTDYYEAGVDELHFSHSLH